MSIEIHTPDSKIAVAEAEKIAKALADLDTEGVCIKLTLTERPPILKARGATRAGVVLKPSARKTVTAWPADLASKERDDGR